MERYRPQNNDAKHTSDQKDMPKKARSPNGPDPLIVDAPPLSPEDVPMEASGPVTLDDFVAYLPKHSYIFRPTGEVWEAGGVNARIPPIKKDFPATRWLDRNRGVEQITWSPGEPTDIKGKLIRDGGWIQRDGASVFNLYKPPTLVPRKGSVKLWRDHLHDIYTSDADHMEKWLAHRVQRPGEKLNHAMVMGGDPGIGKDTILEPIVHAVGQWNWKEVSPQKLFGRFNEFVKSVVLRVNEAHDLGEFDRYSFYDRTKVYAAAPPDILEVDAKNLREHYVPNVTAMIITSNHKEDGLYLPADDRRHYVAWSDATMDQFDEEYWNRIWDWYASGGIEHVAYYLANLDLSDFDPKAPPPKTDAFWAIADASRAPEDAEMADAIDELGETKRDGTIERPKVTMVEQVRQQATGTFKEWLGDRKNARQVPHRFSACGYERVRNPYAADGFWKIGGQRQNIYARKELSQQERLKAAEELRKTERARRQDEEDCEKRHWRR